MAQPLLPVLTSTAAAEYYNESDYDKPDVIIVKKIAQTVIHVSASVWI